MFENLKFGDQPIINYGTNEDPLFKACEIGKILEIKNIRMSLRNFDDEKIIKKDITKGGEQNLLFLTEIGFYRFVLQSRKPKAKEFQTWIFGVIKKLRINGRYDLFEEKLEESPVATEFITDDLKIKRQNILLENIKQNDRVIYLIEFKNEINGKKIIKLGETNNLKQRLYCIEKQFNETVILSYVFRCEDNHRFEQFLHKLPIFKKNIFKEQFPNGEKSRETYILSDYFSYNIILKIINENIKDYEKLSYEDFTEYQKLQNEKKRLELVEKQMIENKAYIEKELINKMTNTLKNTIELEKTLELSKNYEGLIGISNFFSENPDYLEILKNLGSILRNPEDVKKLKEVIQNKALLDENYGKIFIKEKVSNSPYVQKYNEEGELIEYYDSIIKCIRENEGFSTSGLKHAVKNKTVYHGFRWLLIEREKDPNETFEIGKTKEINRQRKELIAFLNLNQDKVLKVYPDQKTVAYEYQVSHGAICSAIKRNSRSQGGYFKYYDDLTDEVKETYEENLPEIPSQKNSNAVYQIHPITGETIKLFKSVSDVIRECQMSRISLKKAIDTNDVLKGFRWKIKELD